MKGAFEQNFIYVLKCPLSGDIRYVGKTDNPRRRIRRHVADARNGAAHHCGRWIRKLLSQGLAPIMDVIRTLEAGEDWQAAEIEEIAKHRLLGLRLTNCTDGGEGAALTDPELIAKRNLAAKIGAAKPEVKARMVEGIKAYWAEPGARQEMSEKQKIIAATPEERLNRSNRMKKLWVEKRDVLRCAQSSPEAKEAHSKRIKAAWADPKIRKKMEEVNRSETSRKKKSQGATERWADPANRALAVRKAKDRATPEYRAMMAEKTRLSWEKRRANTAAKKAALRDTIE